MFYINLDNLADAKSIKDILDTFHTSTGISIRLVDLQGKIILVPDTFEEYSFCKLIKSKTAGQQHCKESCKSAGSCADIYGQPYIFKCHAGLIGWAIPIKVGQAHLYTLICTQVMTTNFEKTFWDGLKRMAKELDLDEEALISEARKIQVISPGRFQIAIEALHIVSCILGKGDFKFEDETLNFRIDDLMLKKSGVESPDLDALVKSIRQKDRENAIAYTHKMMKEIVNENTEVTPYAKNQVADLFLVISTTLADMEVDSTMLLNITNAVNKGIYNSKSWLELYNIFNSILEALFDKVLPKEAKESQQTLIKAIEYIKANYMKQDLQLISISATVYISATYLCHLFKKEIGITVNEYINQIRVEEAKKLLKANELMVTDIARKVGFSHHSYFTKVFKKSTGITPENYKNRYS